MSMSNGNQHLFDKGANFVEQVRQEAQFFNDMLATSQVKSKDALLDNNALIQIKLKARKWASSTAKTISNEEAVEQNNTNNQLLVLCGQVMECCLAMDHSSLERYKDKIQGWQPQIEGLLYKKEELKFETAEELKKLGIALSKEAEVLKDERLRKLGGLLSQAGELFTPIGLANCNFGIIFSFMKEFS